IDSAKLIPNADEIAEQLPFMGLPDKAGSAYLRSALLAVINHFKADPKSRFSDLPKEVSDAFLHGLPVQLKFRQRLYEAPSEKVRVAIEEMVSPAVCSVCGGRRLRADSLAVRVGGRGISDYT